MKTDNPKYGIAIKIAPEGTIKIQGYIVGHGDPAVGSPGHTVKLDSLGLEFVNSASGTKVAVREEVTLGYNVKLYTACPIVYGVFTHSETLCFKQQRDFFDFGESISFSEDEKLIIVSSRSNEDPAVVVYHFFLAEGGVGLYAYSKVGSKESKDTVNFNLGISETPL